MSRTRTDGWIVCMMSFAFICRTPYLILHGIKNDSLHYTPYNSDPLLVVLLVGALLENQCHEALLVTRTALTTGSSFHYGSGRPPAADPKTVVQVVNYTQKWICIASNASITPTTTRLERWRVQTVCHQTSRKTSNR